jgi:SPX domain protein involved in polyphosphate accumulation
MSPSTDFRERREFAFEMKFLVSLALAGQLGDWARAQLLPDPNAGGATGDVYKITSLYLDTDAFDVFHRRGSYGRSKLRIRRYGQTELLFLERKLRTRRMLAKRRSTVWLSELGRLEAPEPVPDWAGYWFHRRLLARALKPVCQISYHRLARVAMTPSGPIRLTIDHDLRGILADRLDFKQEQGPLLMEDTCVLELKFRRELPVPFKNLVQEFALSPKSFSKYRHAVRVLALASAVEPGTFAPAYA